MFPLYLTPITTSHKNEKVTITENGQFIYGRFAATHFFKLISCRRLYLVLQFGGDTAAKNKRTNNKENFAAKPFI